MLLQLYEMYIPTNRTLLELGREWTLKSDSSLSSSLVTRLESTWLHSAKVARKAGHTQQGEWALLGAGNYSFLLLIHIGGEV